MYYGRASPHIPSSDTAARGHMFILTHARTRLIKWGRAHPPPPIKHLMTRAHRWRQGHSFGTYSKRLFFPLAWHRMWHFASHVALHVASRMSSFGEEGRRSCARPPRLSSHVHVHLMAASPPSWTTRRAESQTFHRRASQAGLGRQSDPQARQRSRRRADRLCQQRRAQVPRPSAMAGRCLGRDASSVAAASRHGRSRRGRGAARNSGRVFLRVPTGRGWMTGQTPPRIPSGEARRPRGSGSAACRTGRQRGG